VTPTWANAPERDRRDTFEIRRADDLKPVGDVLRGRFSAKKSWELF
jgi:hypothetical protein